MSPQIIHRCQHCGYESGISSSLSAFTENPYCRQCGLSASEGDSKMQDELSMLINQQLSLNPTTTQTVPERQMQIASPITYITQHYHHSGHLAAATSPQHDDVKTSLANHGINPAALSPSQVNLFANADPDQQSRLVELWQIAPPSYPDRHVGNWPQTSMSQEEEAARQRFLKLTSPHSIANEAVDVSSQTLWQPHESSPQFNQTNAEPYILNGYADGSATKAEHRDGPGYSHALDPIYQGRGWWEHGSDKQPMEHQYGSFAQMRQFYGSAQEDEEML